MQGTALRSQLRTNVPGHQVLTGTVTVASGVPAVGNGKQFTVGRGVLSLTVAASPTIVGAPNGTYTGVPVTTTTGSTAVCSLTVSGGSGVISAAAVTEPGYDYTAANAMSVAVGSLFWTASSLASTTAVAGTYFVPIATSGGSGMIARVVTNGTAITSAVVNPTTQAGTAVGSGYGTSPITYSLPADALYSGSPAVANAFVLTPNPTITGVGTITPVITGNISVIYPGQVVSTVSAQATPIATVGDVAFIVTYRFGGTRYANFGTLTNIAAGPAASLTFLSATPSDGDGFAFSIVTTDTAVTV